MNLVMRQQPLATQKDSRAYEKYLTHMLRELCQSEFGEIKSELEMYQTGEPPLTALTCSYNANKILLSTALQVVETELRPVNQRRVLRDGHSMHEEHDEAIASTRVEKHRDAEKRRRALTRAIQEDLSLYFFVPGQGKISVGELLLYGKFTDLISKRFYLPGYPSRRVSASRQSGIPGAH